MRYQYLRKEDTGMRWKEKHDELNSAEANGGLGLGRDKKLTSKRMHIYLEPLMRIPMKGLK
jgi:hypothetical protein